ncbi:MAG TPA: hypothetical protein VNK25_00345 [Candidatus Nitrosotenuis sp.]|jgi:hypothetical protein|nr:hypothetical protein [Candidatus Nitrosotenuis sp.]
MDEQEELSKLFNSTKELGEKDEERLFEQYKVYLEMIDSLNERRATANSFFLSISTGLLTALGVLFNLGTTLTTNSGWVIVGSISGILFSYTWLRTVKSYRQLSSGKWKIVTEIEKRLPLSLHGTEWKILGEGKNKSLYKPLTDVEKVVPLIFLGIFVVLIIISATSNFITP